MKDKILNDFESRFSKDMKNFDQEQRQNLEKELDQRNRRESLPEKKPTKEYDRGMSR